MINLTIISLGFVSLLTMLLTVLDLFLEALKPVVAIAVILSALAKATGTYVEVLFQSDLLMETC